MRLGTLTLNTPSLALARRLVACSLLRVAYANELLTNYAKAAIVGSMDEDIRREMVLAALVGNISRAETLLAMLPKIAVDAFMIRSPLGKSGSRDSFSVSGEICT